MTATKSRAVSAKGVQEFRPYITRALPLGAQIICADNTGAKILEIVMVQKTKTRVARYPSAAVGDFVNVVVKKGPGELRGQILDRKSTRLNSSHRCISYAVFCLKKK